MKVRFVDVPVSQSFQAYQDAVGGMVRVLSGIDAVKCIYQIGGVSSPGISDIDLYIVFHDGSTFTGNPVKDLTGTPRYLFTHNLFGTSERLAVCMEPFTLFGKYQLLYGEDVNMKGSSLNHADSELIGKQVALEYLAKAYLSISASSIAGVIKARNLLLHAKALLLDLKLLDRQTGLLYNTLESMLKVRNDWFSDNKAAAELATMIIPYKEGLREMLQEQIQAFRFYVMEGTDMNVAKNMRLRNGEKVSVSTGGIRIPGFLNASVKQLHGIHKRVSRIELSLPLTTTEIPEIIRKRTLLIREAENLNRITYPGFLPTAYGLHIFKTS